MRRFTIRQKVGAVALDWPRFIGAVTVPGRWVRYRNRAETITADPQSGGVRCEWRFTSDLHICEVFPSSALMLFRRAQRRWPFAIGDRRSSPQHPDVSFVIGHRGATRLPHLLKTISSIGGQTGAEVECIVVEQSERPLTETRLPPWVSYVHTPIASDSLPYNRSAALNEGARLARGRIVVLHDNDFLVPSAYAAELVRRHAEGWEFMDLKRFMFYLGEQETQRLALSDDFRIEAAPEHVTQNLLAGGSVAADRDAYFAIGGFDESFVGWGGEDNDFWERASTRAAFSFGYLPLVHLWHAPQVEKVAAAPIGGRARMIELSAIPPHERIRRLTSSTAIKNP